MSRPPGRADQNQDQVVLLSPGMDPSVDRAPRSERAPEPLLARRGQGCLLHDSRGRALVDWIMGRGALVLGYRRPEVEAAIAEQLQCGTMFSLPHALEIEVARTLHQSIPCAEKVAFGKNGSDVCAGAVRVARAATGRDGILHFGYHGFHDWCAAANRDWDGIPEAVRGLLHGIPYNDLSTLESLLTHHGDKIAAVIMEPWREELPRPGYLEGVRALTREHKALLIFDEMVTGFRFGIAGAQGVAGVTPDLACFGKGLANGMPLSALCGKADLIDQLDRVGYGMTARGETLSLAAARAALAVYRQEPVAERIAAAGEAVRQRFAQGCARAGVDAALVGHPAMMTFRFGHADHGAAGPELKARFLTQCLEHGVLTDGHLLPSAAHDAAAVERTGQAFEQALVAACKVPERAGG